MTNRTPSRVGRPVGGEPRSSTMTHAGSALLLPPLTKGSGRGARLPLPAVRVAIVIAIVALVPALRVSAALGTATLFSDPAGDTSESPDLTDIGVAHTAARDLTITVAVANEPILLTGHLVELRLDTDMDVSTGAPNGVDRLIHRLWTGSTRLCTWAGALFLCTDSPNVTSTYVDGLLTVMTTAEALGIGTGFDFSVAGYGGFPIDFAPNLGTWRYLVEVADVVPPVLVVPDVILVNATSPTGAQVSFAATVTDDVDPEPTVVCNPPSGSAFPLGTTTVTCTATDATGNSASASFAVHVSGAEAQLGSLFDSAVGDNLGPGTSFVHKLRQAQAVLSDGDETSACGMLKAFINQVQAQDGRTLTSEQVVDLSAAANQIRAVLGC